MIASEPILNELSKRAQLLIDIPIPPPKKPFQEPIYKPKLQKGSRKIFIAKEVIAQPDNILNVCNMHLALELVKYKLYDNLIFLTVPTN